MLLWHGRIVCLFQELDVSDVVDFVDALFLLLDLLFVAGTSSAVDALRRRARSR